MSDLLVTNVTDFKEMTEAAQMTSEAARMTSFLIKMRRWPNKRRSATRFCSILLMTKTLDKAEMASYEAENAKRSADIRLESS